MGGQIIIHGDVSNSIIQQDVSDCEIRIEQASEVLEEIKRLIASEKPSEYLTEIVVQLDNLEQLIQQNANPSLIRRCVLGIRQLSANATSGVIAGCIVNAIDKVMQ